MEIKNKSTLAEKQAYWAEQLPNFEAKYWLPSHFDLLKFDMDQGSYVVKDDLDPTYEDDADEIWHRVTSKDFREGPVVLRLKDSATNEEIKAGTRIKQKEIS